MASLTYLTTEGPRTNFPYPNDSSIIFPAHSVMLNRHKRMAFQMRTDPGIARFADVEFVVEEKSKLHYFRC